MSLVGGPNLFGVISSGVYQNSNNATILDLSGNGTDLSGTQMLKVAPFGSSNNSFYALFDLSNNTINNVDCSGFNIIRVAGGTVRGVGYIANPSNVNSFVCDSSENLWVGGNGMTVKDTNGGSAISNTRCIFTVPRENVTAQPTPLINVDVSGCNDIIKVNNLMVASITDVSGSCLNYVSSGTSSTLSVDGVTFPRMFGNTAAFPIFLNVNSGSYALPNQNMDASGHRLVAFKRDGSYGNDVSGVYVVRQNSNFTGTASTTDNTNDSNDSIGIPHTATLNKLGYDSGRNKLYALPGTDGNYPFVISLDASSNVRTTNYPCYSDALISYAAATGTTTGAVDASGFMVVCTNPLEDATYRTVLLLDASGTSFDTLTLHDVSGVIAMATTTAAASSTASAYNYIFLVDASRNQIPYGQPQFATLPKLAQIKLSTRSENSGQYQDGSGVTFVASKGSSAFGYRTSTTNGYSYVRDLRIDANGNIFLAGHQINIKNSSAAAGSITSGVGQGGSGVASSGDLAAASSTTTELQNNAGPTVSDATDSQISATQSAAAITALLATDDVYTSSNARMSGDAVARVTALLADINKVMKKLKLLKK